MFLYFVGKIAFYHSLLFYTFLIICGVNGRYEVTYSGVRPHELWSTTQLVSVACSLVTLWHKIIRMSCIFTQRERIIILIIVVNT